MEEVKGMVNTVVVWVVNVVGALVGVAVPQETQIKSHTQRRILLNLLL